MDSIGNADDVRAIEVGVAPCAIDVIDAVGVPDQAINGDDVALMVVIGPDDAEAVVDCLERELGQESEDGRRYGSPLLHRGEQARWWVQTLGGGAPSWVGERLENVLDDGRGSLVVFSQSRGGASVARGLEVIEICSPEGQIQCGVK